jgi:hypothetical protein
LTVSAEPQRWRPALLPKSRWARVTLLLLVLFALLRSVLWASIQPAWVAPDEDYHWLYVNYLVVEHRVPDLHKGEYNVELNDSVALTQQGTYLGGARRDYTGSPHAILSRLKGLSRKLIQPVPRQVIEAPLYYVPAAIVDKLLWRQVSVTRLTALRYYSAVLGALTVFFAWLLAAQILAREWQQLAAAALASLQMILAFSASTITNDAGVALTMTATLAWCAWMLRGPPRARQGIGLGVLISIAVLTKATMLLLSVVVLATLLLLWRTYPQARRQLGGVLAWTIGIPAILAGWWYVYLHATTNSVLGEAHFGPAAKAAPGGPALLTAISHMPAVAWVWIQQVYRNYWFSYLFYEVRAGNVWFWLPVVGIVIVAAGFVLFLVRGRRTVFRPEGGPLRSVLIITMTALLLWAIPMWKDVWSAVHGGGFLLQQGRFMTPAYPGLAAIAVLAIGELTARRRRLYPVAVAGLIVGAFLLYWYSWVAYVLRDFYGVIAGHWLRALLHASYDKPSFITQNSLLVIWLLALAAFGGACLLGVVVWRREEQVQPMGAENRPSARHPVSAHL